MTKMEKIKFKEECVSILGNEHSEMYLRKIISELVNKR